MLQDLGWRGAVVHFRGCSGSPNRLPRAYHAGDSTEIDWILRADSCTKQTLGHHVPVFAVGVSLGGNALLKWLGEQGKQACHLLDGVVTVSVPLDLAAAGRLWLRALICFIPVIFSIPSSARRGKNSTDFPAFLMRDAVAACSTLYEFDNLVTAPLHGFRNTEDYWDRSSSKPWLKHIQVPTLVINALNDPFMPPSALPRPKDVSPAVVLEFPEQGGHAGFLNPPFPGRLVWLPERIIQFFWRAGGPA